MKLHFLSAGMKSPNGRATLFPLITYGRDIKQQGHEIRWFREPTIACLSADVVCVELKYLTHFRRFDRSAAISFVKDLAIKTPSLWMFDNSDSTSIALPEILSDVDLYLKNQLLLNQENYLIPFLGSTMFTGFYANLDHGMASELRLDDARFVHDKRHLDKLTVGWNSGISDHSRTGPQRLRIAKKAARFLPAGGLRQLLRKPTAVASPDSGRPIPFHCRMNFSYQPRIFSAQRRLLANKLNLQPSSTRKLDRTDYFDELCSTWAVISPFGYGEITLKDFEAFLCGNLLVKPDMGHMETWPPVYEPWTTYVPVKWDLSDVEERLYDINHNRDRYLPIAVEGQRRYLHFLSSGRMFAERISELARTAAESRA